jgi:antitoxin ParD1/3/4
LREGVGLVDERETRLAALDASIARGLDDATNGRVHDIDAVAAARDKPVDQKSSGNGG